jgi:two-component system nitrate/nitrite response regulator NarL
VDRQSRIAFVPPARVVLAVEIRLYRETLARALAASPVIDLLAVPCNRDELEVCLTETAPQVLVLDVGITDAKRIVRALAKNDQTGVVALGVRGLPDEVITLAEAGVAGYVTRDDPLDRLLAVILSVARGEMPGSPRISWHLMRRLARLAADIHDAPLGRLTVREVEILRLVEQGLQNKQIAARLSIQLATVKNHVGSILEKLEVATRGEAAAVIRRHG